MPHRVPSAGRARADRLRGARAGIWLGAALALGIWLWGAPAAATETLPTPDVVAKVTPSVVNVYAQRLVQRRRPSLLDDPFFRRFFGDRSEGLFGPQTRLHNALGSGVIVDGRGIIVTNYHVIEHAEQLRVVLSDRREFEADLVLGDARTDLAVLRIRGQPARFQALDWRNSDNVRIGDAVLAIGNPFGVGQTVTGGIVSALARAQIGVTDYQSFIQTDAAINPGNSGGALVTMDGRLLGINTAIFTRSGGSVGIGFAIPSNLVRQVVRAALKEGKLVLPWLGADLAHVSADLARSLSLQRPRGALIKAIHPQSPLMRAGLKPGDVVLKLGGHEISSPENLRYRFATQELDARQTLVWQHKGQQRSAAIVLAAPPDQPPREETVLSGRHALGGLTVANLNPSLLEELRISVAQSGVVVLAVAPGSAAQRFGFRSGDILLRLNARRLDAVRTLQAVLRAGAINRVEIRRSDTVLRADIR